MLSTLGLSGVARAMSPRQGGIAHEMLALAATGRRHGVGEPAPIGRPEYRDANQLQFVLDAGLGPLLDTAVRDGRVQVPPAWIDPLKSANLCAQVRHGNLVDCADEIIDLCNAMGVPVTLLKGISISDQHYPEAHTRSMGDLDILVPEHDRDGVEAALLRHGYRRSTLDMGEGSCHGPPLRDERREVWVEVHSGLFPTSAALVRNHLFSPSQIAAQSVASTFRGRPVLRLTNEMQLVYIASYWIRDLTQNKPHPSFLFPLFDAIYLLGASGEAVDWNGMLDWLDNEMAMASLYLLLAYICESRFDDSAAGILSRLASRQRIVGPADARTILRMLDAYLVHGKPLARRYSDWHATILLRTLETLLTPGTYVGKRLRLPWNCLFPPAAPDRYSFRFHKDRMARILRAVSVAASEN